MLNHSELALARSIRGRTLPSVCQEPPFHQFHALCVRSVSLSHCIVPLSLTNVCFVGFMAFVANLQKQYLQQQFALFCWVHMTLLVIVVSRYVPCGLAPIV